MGELWAPFANNLERWIDSIGPKARLVRGFTPPEQEQQIIDTLARRDPAAIPWQSAEDSPYVYGVAATVSIPERDIPKRCVRLSPMASSSLRTCPGMLNRLGCEKVLTKYPMCQKASSRGTERDREYEPATLWVEPWTRLTESSTIRTKKL